MVAKFILCFILNLFLSMAIWHLSTYLCAYNFPELHHPCRRKALWFYVFCRSHNCHSFIWLHLCRFNLYLLQTHRRQGLLLVPFACSSQANVSDGQHVDAVLVSQFEMFTISKQWNSIQGWKCLCFPYVKPPFCFCAILLMAWADTPMQHSAHRAKWFCRS